MPPRWASLAASACTREGRSRHFDLVGGGGYLWTIDLTAAAILVVGFACACGPLTREEGLRVPVRLTGAHNVSNAVNSFWQAVLSWAQFCCNAVELLN